MIKLLQWLVRIAGLGALALGITFLFAPGLLADGLLRLHLTLGGIVALALATLAVWALIDRVRIPAAIAALFWAAGTVYVGVQVVAGGHLAVEIVHPLLGVGAISLAEMLAAALTRAKFTR